ncbi:hypothetical protein [Streptomyces phaeochromogenes]|uniref:hypothetical protein n=1 Tax=Streptomyces phaeochromogenes TaxID=1923 RepID=UPI002DDB6F6E|nr:hypothetical protein [Streptomyces phaeochromogenes]WRZ31181.1 hypothetical protein OG931_27270 [Streptomyces phaeochromogenes]
MARWTGVWVGVAGAAAGEAGGAEVRGWSGGLAGAGVAGVAEVTGGRVAGPGRAAVGPVVDTFPEVGAPRPRRRAGAETLRCTGRGPAPDCVLGGTGLVVGVVGPPRLGPGAAELAEGAFPACEPGATGLPGLGVRLSAGAPAAGPTG